MINSMIVVIPGTVIETKLCKGWGCNGHTASWCSFALGTCELEISVRIESRIELAVTIWIRINMGSSCLHVQCRLWCGSCVCALATAVQLHVKWSCKHKSQLQTTKGWRFCWTVSERSLWYDDTRHVRPIENFRISTSLLNQIRIGKSDSNLNRISKLRRSLLFM